MLKTFSIVLLKYINNNNKVEFIWNIEQENIFGLFSVYAFKDTELAVSKLMNFDAKK